MPLFLAQQYDALTVRGLARSLVRIINKLKRIGDLGMMNILQRCSR